MTCWPTERCCVSCWHPQHPHQASLLRELLGKAVSALAAGPAALRRTVEADVIRLRKYEVPIKRVARRLCLDPALIAAIISQESRAGLLLNNGWDQGQQRYGLMQVQCAGCLRASPQLANILPLALGYEVPMNRSLRVLRAW